VCVRARVIRGNPFKLNRELFRALPSSTLQHAATHCQTPQHTATHLNELFSLNYICDMTQPYV